MCAIRAPCSRKRRVARSSGKAASSQAVPPSAPLSIEHPPPLDVLTCNDCPVVGVGTGNVGVGCGTIHTPEARSHSSRGLQSVFLLQGKPASPGVVQKPSAPVMSQRSPDVGQGSESQHTPLDEPPSGANQQAA